MKIDIRNRTRATVILIRICMVVCLMVFHHAIVYSKSVEGGDNVEVLSLVSDGNSQNELGVMSDYTKDDMKVQGGSSMAANNLAVDFSFRPGEELLLQKYANNNLQLDKLQNIIASDGAEVSSGNYHIRLTSFVSDKDDFYACNMANIQASIVRAYMKTQYAYTNLNFVYGQNASTGVANRIRVEIVRSPVPAGANQVINYTLNPESRAWVRAQQDNSPLRTVSDLKLGGNVVVEQEKPEYLKDSMTVIFRYKQGQELLLKLYKDNLNELDRLRSIVQKHYINIATGKYHFRITSSVLPEADYYDNNMANIQASIARAYVKVSYGFNNTCFVYQKNTDASEKNVIEMRLIDGPVPKGANQIISYTLNPNSPAWMMAGDDRYSVSMAQTDIASSMGVYDEKGQEIQRANMLEMERLDLKPIGLQLDDTTQEYQFYPKQYVPVKGVRSMLYPRIAIKTNLLYWAATTASVQAEVYLPNRFSITVQGVYTIWEANVWKKNYAVNSISPEFRLWLNDDNRFHGHFFGIYGQIGQYDYMFKDADGRTGDYYGGGLSYGYMLPIARNWAFEFGIRAGLLSASNDSYEFETPDYYWIESNRKNYFGVTDLSVSLVYRFGKRRGK